MGPEKKRKQQSTGGPAPKRNKSSSQTKASTDKTGKANDSGKGKGKFKGQGQGKGKGQARGRAVDAAALEWQSVGEEFGGLEVIEGVDVVRSGGAVQFVVVDAKDKSGATKTEKKKTKDDKDDREDSDGGDEAFEGLGDGAVEGEDVDSGEAGGDADGVEGAEPEEQDGGQGATKPKSGKDEASKASKAGKASDSSEKKKQKKKGKAGGKDDGKKSDADMDIINSSSSGKNAQGNSFDALMAVDEDANANEEVDMGAWMGLSLSPQMVSALAALGFTRPTTIQERAIPEIVAGRDVIGKAQTGSGKTLAFGIPLVERWLEMQEQRDQRGEHKEEAEENDDDNDNNDDDEEEEAAKEQQQQRQKRGKRTGPMAVVLSPTRELAKQLADHLKALCDGLPGGPGPYVCTVTGGLSIQKQQRQLERADIVIGTPGRLWEVLDGDMRLQGEFTKIRFLVVDEADRLFKAGQFKEAEDIIGALDRRDPEAADDDDDNDGGEDDEQVPPRQTLVFSATFDKDLQSKLAGKARGNKAGTDAEKMEYLMKCLKFRSQPTFIDVNPVTHMAEGLKEGLVECGAMEKDLYLYTVLALNPGKRTLVFTNSISAVRRLTPLLGNLGLTALPLHSQMIQKARLRSVERFAASRASVLIATDVAARGLDIDDIDQVLHYHVPRAADTYIHRSGRTARGGRTGLSVMLCSPEEVLPTRRLAAKVHAERSGSGGGGAKRHHMIETLAINGNIASRLRTRVDLAKRLADAVLAKERAHSEDTWLRGAAEELGVEYDSEEFEAGWNKAGGGGRGGGRRKAEKAARQLSKAEMGALRARLREELGRRVNLGVSERYITGGRVDVGALLREREKGSVGGLFLGGEGLLGMSL
ncbi:ATP-dependent RNA helicase MAK5 [Escovopsis weberi]|uniref:ATP-dependent RNA helicase n=1 Tax=Escovopsis weberi TaxID=150374 RepID=A0A0M9VWK7_ESCWE|nr:ATP-dependent RNA helicase MAK5 [Escovopsis weberi]